MAACLALGLMTGEARAEDPCAGTSNAFTVLNFSSRTLEAESWVFGEMPSRIQKCQDRDLAKQIRDGRDLDQLLNRKIVLALIEVGDEIRYYIIPTGLSLQPPAENRCLDRSASAPTPPHPRMVRAAAKPDPATVSPSVSPPLAASERWKALLGAAIALYEERRFIANPCAGDPQAAVRLINQARASLLETAADPGERTLHERLNPRDLVNRATAGGCGPRDLNRRLLDDLHATTGTGTGPVSVLSAGRS